MTGTQSVAETLLELHGGCLHHIFDRDPRLAGRARDLLTDEVLADAYRRASRAAPGAAGESDRKSLRTLVEPALGLACLEEDRERRERYDRADPPRDGFRASLALSSDPERLRGLLGRWQEIEDEMDGARAGAAEARNGLASRLGAGDENALVGATHAVPPDEVEDLFRRGLVEPGDDRAAEAARTRRLRSRSAGWTEPGAAEVPGRAALAEHCDAFPASRIAPILRRLGQSLGEDPDVHGPILRPHGGDGRPWPSARPHGDPRPVLELGAWPGPGGLRESLAAFGRCAHAGAVRRVRGDDAWLGCEPAFATAAEVVFRRLPLNTRFCQDAGLRHAEAWSVDVRHEESIDPRRAWAYLAIAQQRASGADGSEADRAWVRATGWPPTPGERAGWWRCGPRSAADLRGTALGVLLEERLLTRFGRGWFAERAMARFLLEAWAAEPEETPESMASALGLGRIEPTAVFDACRPPAS